MKAALVTLFSSKKFQTLVIGLMVAAGARYGLALDPETCGIVLGFFAVLIHAQGQADIGKEAAKVTAAGPAAPSAISVSMPGATVDVDQRPAVAVRPPEQGSVRLGVVGSLCAVALILVACGAHARDTAIATSLTSLNAARDGVLAYDQARQDAIVAAAPSEAAGVSALDTYKKRRAVLTAKLEAAYLALSAAALLNDDRSLTTAITAVSAVRTAWEDLHGGGAL